MVFLAGIVLAVALVVPTAWFPVQLGKVAVFVLAMTLSAVLFLLGRGSSELSRTQGLKLALLSGLLPLAYLVSFLFAKTGSLSVSGFGVEVDTLAFTVIGFVSFLLSFALFKTLRTAKMLTSTLTWALAGVTLFQLVIVLFGTGIVPFEIFNDRSVNLVGKWNDFGLVLALFATLLIIRAELGRVSLPWRLAAAVSLVAVVGILALVNFTLAWWVILAASAVIGLTTYLTQRTEERTLNQSNPYTYTSWADKTPWFSLAGVVVSVVFLLYGAGINQSLSNMFPVTSLEVRPSYTSTYDVISKAREGSLQKSLIGTGPNTFSESWIMHKPAEVNQSAFWNLDFSVGFSTLATTLGTVGLLGALAWLVPLFLVLIAALRAVRLNILSRDERVVALSVVLGTLILFGGIILYVPSPSVTLLAFISAGAAFGYLWRQGRQAMQEVPYLQQMLGLAAVLVVIGLSLWGTWVADRRFLAQAKNNQGAVALTKGNAEEALAKAQASQAVEVTQDNLRLAVEAGIYQLGQIANGSDSSQAAQQKFLAVASTTAAHAKVLLDAYPNDYRSYNTAARIYDLLASVKIQGAYQNAEALYQKALAYNPSAPNITLALARLEASQNKIDLTQKYLTQTLTLKPNYTDAILLVVQLNVANNDIPNAIRAATAAAQTAPGVAPIWFELGLLYYTSGDTKSAVQPLETAIKVAPDYANAKYFLGLSYHAQKRTADAVKLFEDLVRTNPDSAEAKLILANMQAGKAPFDSAEPPITNKPQNRSSAPLSE